MNEHGYLVEGLEGTEADFNEQFGSFILLPECGNDPDQKLAGNSNATYNLAGAQVEPEAGYWSEGPPSLPRVVPIEEVLNLTLDEKSEFYVRPYTDYQPFYNEEIQELAYLGGNRDQDIKTIAPFNTYSPGYYFGDDPADDPVKYQYLPVSDFLQLHSPPFGAIFNIKDNFQYLVEDVNQQHRRRNIPNPADPRTEIISRGRELARMFEIETPGLFHRHALNYIFYKRGEISPIRQARVWMALDVAIYSALIAAWHFKWAADPSKYSYRQRPYEYDRNQSFRVLFDDVVSDAGLFDKCAKTCPCPSPGTPRHPAYSSGHSTFSSAGSEILKYFFRDDDTQTQLDRLANNIGTARLWAGVHWRSDHIAGVQIGRAVAYLLRKQLEQDCISPVDAGNPCAPFIPPCDRNNMTLPPSHDELQNQARARRSSGNCEPCQDVIPPQRTDDFDDCGESVAAF